MKSPHRFKGSCSLAHTPRSSHYQALPGATVACFARSIEPGDVLTGQRLVVGPKRRYLTKHDSAFEKDAGLEMLSLCGGSPTIAVPAVGMHVEQNPLAALV